MAQTGLLILPAVPGGDAILSGIDGVQRVSPDQTVTAQDVTVILPGQAVRLFDTELPKAGRAQQLKMARFAREDDIAGSADALHYALSDAQPPRLAVVDRAQMEVLLATLETMGLRATAAYADYDLLAGETAVRVLDRVVEPGVAAVDPDWTDAPNVQPSDTDLVALFSDGIARGGLNLLQGDYRIRSQMDLPKPALIRFGALAAMALVAAFVWSGVQGRAQAAQAEQLRAQTAAEYLAATGQTAPARPGRAAARAAQATPENATGFLDLSAVLFAGLESVENVRVDQLRYRAANNSLELRFIYPDFGAASDVEAAIAAAGGRIATGGVREQGGSFIGEATLILETGS